MVFIIRAINTQKFIRFNLHTPKLIFNTVILGIQTVYMLFELPMWIAVQAAGVILIFAMNARPILKGALRVLKRGR